MNVRNHPIRFLFDFYNKANVFTAGSVKSF